MIYNFCGATKGKTSSALGTVLRALGSSKKVRIVFFMKHWNTSEAEFLREAKKHWDVDFYQSGDKDFIYVKGVNNATLKEAQGQLKFGHVEPRDDTDVAKAERGMRRAWDYLQEEPFLLVLDELNYAVTFGLIPVQDAKALLHAANECRAHVIITGKDAHPELAELCDLVTEMKKVKHPYDRGVYGVKGLDY